jgi:putative protein-disulfide isomerase
MKEDCDPETGICTPSDLTDSDIQSVILEKGKEIIYVGDPMCSWCWGIANHLQKLKAYFPQYKFTIVVGGLRPGGGDAWNDEMKEFLRHHWDEVKTRSGQPFGYDIFDKGEFNYDTEPPCRAVVISRRWVGANELSFFESVSRKFYVDNENPSDIDFYKSICKEFQIPFADFKQDFLSDQLKMKTNAEFQMNRQWGLTGFPTVLFINNDELFKINYGYREFEQMKDAIEKIVGVESAVADE